MRGSLRRACAIRVACAAFATTLGGLNSSAVAVGVESGGASELAILFEMMTDVDEGMQEWRYRHVKIVERTIGSKQGTGGSPGVEFLKKTLFNPIFPDLWAIRHSM